MASERDEPSGADPAPPCDAGSHALAELPTGAFPELGTRSVVVRLDAGVAPAPEERLRDLPEDVPLPPLRMGPEKYRILGLLGEGGMGTVYLAYDQDLKRRVALKLIKGELGGDARRFLEEAQVMAQLSHPNIVPLFEVGLVEGTHRPYYTMPVVHGRTLREVLERLAGGAREAELEWSLVRRVQLTAQVAQALAFAHARGVVHRDLKPANVMLGRHGEVLVLDWGIAKVLAEGGGRGGAARLPASAEEGGAETDVRALDVTPGARTERGRLVGTPLYMAPEQVLGRDVDERVDVWALGLLLYELLTLRRPFERPDVLAAIVSEEPRPPREAAPGRGIPVELERICLRALEKDRARRTASVAEMASEMQAWLEAEADRDKRRERAEAKAAEGRRRLEEHRRLKTELRRLEAEATETRARFQPWQEAEEKRPVIAAEERLRGTRRQLAREASAAVTTLGDALAFEPTNPTAQELLADYYWDRFVEAEARQDVDELELLSDLVARYHCGKYARELQGLGSLQLDSRPPGAEARLYRLEEDGFALAPRAERALGTTPLGPVPLEMGSYLVLLSRPGFADVRYPVAISRNRAWTGSVDLLREEEIGTGLCYVPAGPFVQGGDPECMGFPLPRSEPWVDGFLIGRTPVTMGEYLEFLHDLAAREGVEAAEGRSPRRAPEGGSYLARRPGGRLELPGVDAEGDVWSPGWPVFAVSCLDAEAYAGWRSARDGLAWRLPTEAEWEKAARGVDGRWFPWGWRFDASLCNMRDSRRDRSTVARVGEFPADESVYGVRDVGGNVHEWTATEWLRGRGPGARAARVLRGGAWNSSRSQSRCAYRGWDEPHLLATTAGFRLCRSAPGPGGRGPAPARRQ